MEESIPPNFLESEVLDVSGGKTKIRKKNAPNRIVSLPTSSSNDVVPKKRGRPKKILENNQDPKNDPSLIKEEEEKIIEQPERSLEDFFNVSDRSQIETINSNCFKCNYVLDIKLNAKDIGVDMIKNIRKYIMDTYLNWEIRGIMLTDFEFDPDTLLPIGNIWMDDVVIRLPIKATFKLYRIGDIVEGELNFTSDNNLFVKGNDIICYIYKENGNISYKNDKICYKRNKTILYEKDKVLVKIKNIETSTKVPLFVCNAVFVLPEENTPETEI